MPVRISTSALIYVLLIMWSLSLGACQRQGSSAQEPTEARLRERIVATNNYFLGGLFEDFVKMRSKRERSTLFESEEDKKKGFKEWKLFLEREKPTMELLGIEMRDFKAVAKMRGGVQKEDGTRSESIIYDLWIFEDGDWFLDTAGRSSSEYF